MTDRNALIPLPPLRAKDRGSGAARTFACLPPRPHPFSQWERGRASGRALSAAALIVLALALAGCGKRGDPQPPPGEPSTYPRIYPSG